MQWIDELFHFVSAYFEILLAIDLFMFIGFVVIHVAARLRFLRIDRLLNSTFYYLLVTLQVFLVGFTLLIFFVNLGQKRPLDLTAQIEPTTRWVREDRTIFFIDQNQLVAIQADGSHRQVIYRAGERIKQYHFSPNGRFLLITTINELILYRRRDQTARTIDTIEVGLADDHALKGNIGGIRWSPTGKRFCYRLSQWSDFSSIQHWKVYDLDTGRKASLSRPELRFTALVWDRQGQKLYAGRYVRLASASNGDAYRCSVYEMIWPDLRPNKIWTGPTEKMTLPVRDLARSGIHVLIPHRRYSFGKVGQKRTLAHSRQGAEIGVDERDTLYYAALWWRKRLYQVPRVETVGDIPRFQYQGGRLTISDLRFLPSGRYVIMEHYFWGILILDPVSGRIGILDNQRGSTFGWYPD